ncbi:MAG TPA: transcription-repair coupling factor, partial [Chthoniobacterales bacterium]|nr:transcription-repair coupling factor [Chthoniobacterales bacterium]
MEKNSSERELLARVVQAGPIAARLHTIANGQFPVAFSHVTEAAQPFVVAALAREVSRTLWVLCPSVRSQELLYEALLNWAPDALFLPEAEFAAVENILPDPEIAAERLALLTRVSREAGPHVVVTTRAAIDQAAPRLGTLNAAILRLKRGAHRGMEPLLQSLGEAGYERVAQVTTRGQFAVRGGIVDFYSWQAALPVRAEFLGDEIESLREFDLDTQISLRNLQSADVLLGAADEQSGTVRDYIRSDHLELAIEPEDTDEAHIRVSSGWIEEGAQEDFSGAFLEADVADFSAGDFMIVEAKRGLFAARLTEWKASGTRVVIYFQTEGEIERFREIMAAPVAAVYDRRSDGSEAAEGRRS